MLIIYTEIKDDFKSKYETTKQCFSGSKNLKSQTVKQTIECFYAVVKQNVGHGSTYKY